jgi:hypothetical protein
LINIQAGKGQVQSAGFANKRSISMGDRVSGRQGSNRANRYWAAGQEFGAGVELMGCSLAGEPSEADCAAVERNKGYSSTQTNKESTSKRILFMPAWPCLSASLAAGSYCPILHSPVYYTLIGLS